MPSSCRSRTPRVTRGSSLRRTHTKARFLWSRATSSRRAAASRPRARASVAAVLSGAAGEPRARGHLLRLLDDHQLLGRGRDEPEVAPRDRLHAVQVLESRLLEAELAVLLQQALPLLGHLLARECRLPDLQARP